MRAQPSIQFRVLNDDQIEEIVWAALEVLARTGVEVHDEQSRSVLVQAGAHAGDGDRIYLPAGLVHRCLATVPPSVRVCDRRGRTAMRLEGTRAYFGAGSDTPYVLDGAVNALYGDFREGRTPAAILEMQFFLLDDSGARTRIVARHSYRREVQCGSQSGPELVKAWNSALVGVLAEFEQAVRSAGVPAGD